MYLVFAILQFPLIRSVILTNESFVRKVSELIDAIFFAFAISRAYIIFGKWDIVISRGVLSLIFRYCVKGYICVIFLISVDCPTNIFVAMLFFVMFIFPCFPTYGYVAAIPRHPFLQFIHFAIGWAGGGFKLGYLSRLHYLDR